MLRGTPEVAVTEPQMWSFNVDFALIDVRSSLVSGLFITPEDCNFSTVNIAI